MYIIGILALPQVMKSVLFMLALRKLKSEKKPYFTEGEQKGLKYLPKQNKGPEDMQLPSLNMREENELFHPGHVISNTNTEKKCM